MTDAEDVCRLALALPQVEEIDSDGPGSCSHGRARWTWLARPR